MRGKIFLCIIEIVALVSLLSLPAFAADRLTKQDVINSVADATGLSKKDAGAALDAVISTIGNALAKGNSVGLIGFGTFEVKTRAARQGRNPQSGAPINIPKKKVPAFKAGKQLRETVAAPAAQAANNNDKRCNLLSSSNFTPPTGLSKQDMRGVIRAVVKMFVGTLRREEATTVDLLGMDNKRVVFSFFLATRKELCAELLKAPKAPHEFQVSAVRKLSTTWGKIRSKY